ncbi:MAG: response regulator [Deltaproteobacteria bacterium]|nr:response regulator [Deltaproteobacteria bacterium]MBW1910694.1 response regulator [Deltaproteobacteria bacterium]MBW2034771.1 response regulator [Deltaproteobacteria bacterium]MBW2115165.1 response regulator [Deltaproteobacteria bacterium]MBW2169528.1 response regulator [Deltaproteobacteria bacterium]
MTKNILIVDDEKDMLVSLKEGFETYGEIFSVLLAEDGEKAVDKLKENVISLVVTDLRMPRMDGFSLLVHIMTHYPDIPVIIMTAYSRPVMERMAMKIGAVEYIEKPFRMDDLAQKIISTLEKESDGGIFTSVSSGMFTQLIEMEQKTCTVRLVNRSSDQRGVLFFREGELLDARVNNVQGEPAALEILTWDDVVLSIQDKCSQKEKKIEADFQDILIEAMRLRNKTGQTQNAAMAQQKDQ